MNVHEFALYVPDVVYNAPTITLQDPQIIHRITRVLRLQQQQAVILFNRTEHIRVSITAVGKKEIVCAVLSCHTNEAYKPSLSFLLPVLKRDAFEAALYVLVEAGVQDIYPVVTQKAHRAWGGQRERERLERIIISAAEQSKCYHFAQLHDPISLEKAVEISAAKKIFFDADGAPFAQVNQSLAHADSLALLIGPEGDLTAQEKVQVDKHNFMRSKLTPTILRAQDAAGLAACMIRSMHD